MPKYVTDDELELLNSYNIVKEDGTIDYNNYKNWFSDYVNDHLKPVNSLEEVTSVIEMANNISVTALENEQKEEDVPLVNGLLDKKELLEFITSKVDVESLKTDTLDMVTKLLEDDSTENDEIFDQQKEQVKNVVQPLIMKVQFDDNIPKNLEDELVDFFEEKGFDSETIKEILQPQEHEEESNDLERKEKPYNPYSDWKYVYYMWTLGYDYSRFLFSEPKALGDSKKSLFGLKINNGNPGIKGQKKKLNPLYEKEYLNLNSELGLTIDFDELVENLTKDNDKKFFSKLIKDSYLSVKDNVKDIVLFTTKMNDLCLKVAKTIKNKDFIPFGGLDNNEIKSLLIELREPDCNFTLKVKNELVNEFGKNYMKADPKRIVNYANSSFNALTWNADSRPEKYQDMMAEAIATYKLFKEIHENRTMKFKLFSRAEYENERDVLYDMEDVLNRSLPQDKRSFIDKTLKETIIYKNGYLDELEKINNFSLDLAMNSYEIVNDKEQVTIDITLDTEKEEISERSDIVDDLVRNNDL